MKRHISIIALLLIIPAFLFAQNFEDPNAKVKAMGLTDQDINDLCETARGKLPNFYDWGIPAVFEVIFDIEEKPYPKFSSKKEAHDWLAKMWDEKYSCVYCEITQSITGSLDMMALYHEKQRWVYGLYDPDGAFKAPINKIRVINDFLEVKGTLVDYLEYVTKIRPTREVERDPSFKDSLLGMKNRIISYGGKRISEMTPEEIEQNSQ